MSKKNKNKKKDKNTSEKPLYEVGRVVSGTVWRFVDDICYIDLEKGGQAYADLEDLTWNPNPYNVDLSSYNENIEIRGLLTKYNAADGLYQISPKALRPNPWPNIEDIYPIGARVGAKVFFSKQADNVISLLSIDDDVMAFIDSSKFTHEEGFDFSPYCKKGTSVIVEITGYDSKNGKLLAKPNAVGNHNAADMKDPGIESEPENEEGNKPAKTEPTSGKNKKADKPKSQEHTIAETEEEKAERRKNIEVPDYDKIINTRDVFERYRTAVDIALSLHKNAREKAKLPDSDLSEAVERKAMPFKKGNFTLAVVGKMSAGKSTFLNALLGDSHLLPTGFLQTTCAITIVEHADDPYIIVEFGDGHHEKITDRLGERLQNLVAISDEYNDLPVNHINRLILAGKTTKQILNKDVINELEAVGKCNIAPKKLEKYTKEHPIGTIPALVKVYINMPEAYKGWRIVDTPGVDAIGGIEDDTKAFLCGEDKDGNNNVDAIIFIQKGSSDIMGMGLNEFVENTVNNISEEARNRIFFILTHGGAPSFMNHHDEIVGMAKKIFVEYGNNGINDDRLLVVDSLAETLYNDLVTHNENVSNYLEYDTPGPERWHPKAWEDCRQMLFDIENILRKKLKIEVVNESILNQLKAMGNFSALREKLMDFAAKEKKKTFDDFIETIKEDLDDCYKILAKDVEVLQESLGLSPDEFRQKLDEEKSNLDKFLLDVNKFMSGLQTNYSRNKFSQNINSIIGDRGFMESLKNKPNIAEMIKYANFVQAQALKKYQETTAEIKDLVSKHLDNSMVNFNVNISAIDYTKINNDAESKAVEIKYETVYEKKAGIANALKRGLGSLFGNTDWGFKKTVIEHKEVNAEKAKQEFATEVGAQLSKALILLTDAFGTQFQNIVESLDAVLKAKVESSKKRYDEMAEKSDILTDIEEGKKAMQLVKDYSMEFQEFKKIRIEDNVTVAG